MLAKITLFNNNNNNNNKTKRKKQKKEKTLQNFRLKYA